MHKKRVLIQNTISMWQPHYTHQLTESEAEEIIANTVKVFRRLAEWQIKRVTDKSACNQQGLTS